MRETWTLMKNYPCFESEGKLSPKSSGSCIVSINKKLILYYYKAAYLCPADRTKWLLWAVLCPSLHNIRDESVEAQRTPGKNKTRKSYTLKMQNSRFRQNIKNNWKARFFEITHLHEVNPWLLTLGRKNYTEPLLPNGVYRMNALLLYDVVKTTANTRSESELKSCHVVQSLEAFSQKSYIISS